MLAGHEGGTGALDLLAVDNLFSGWIGGRSRTNSSRWPACQGETWFCHPVGGR